MKAKNYYVVYKGSDVGIREFVDGSSESLTIWKSENEEKFYEMVIEKIRFYAGNIEKLSHLLKEVDKNA